MTPIIRGLLAFAVSLFQSRLSLQLEIFALQHQLSVYRRSIRRPHVRLTDRIFWSWQLAKEAEAREAHPKDPTLVGSRPRLPRC
jgi:hypothetical protein